MHAFKQGPCRQLAYRLILPCCLVVVCQGDSYSPTAQHSPGVTCTTPSAISDMSTLKAGQHPQTLQKKLT